MPWQLIYTSAPRGLLSGQSGFCTVARSQDLREALVQRLEQISSYHYLTVVDATRNPTVSAFRIIDLRGTKYHVLTRIQPSGLDFTARTNHLAHHLVFQSAELPQLPSPAAILRYWTGWMSSWQGEPRLLPDSALNSFDIGTRSFLPAQTWQRVTGDAGRAAGLLETEYVRGCYLLCPPGSEQQMLEMFCETLQLLNPHGQHALRPWRHTFTTFLQGEDNPSDFQWRACQEGTPGCQQATQSTAALIPISSVRVPPHSLAKVAREGQKPAAPATVVASAPARLTFQGESMEQNIAAQIPTPAPVWQEPVRKPKERTLLVTINSANLMRLAAFAVLLLVLIAVKYRMGHKHAPPQNTPPVAVAHEPPENVPADRNTMRLSAPPSAATLDANELSFLNGDGPLYIIPCDNPGSFNLSVTNIIRFQNLLNRFDNLAVLPDRIRMSMNTDGWDFATGAPLTVGARKGQALSAQTTAGLECSFDYSNWKSDPRNPVVVHVSFSSPPRAFSVRFGFAAPDNGDPFRLLVVNENNPPEPVHLGLKWLRASQDGLAASLQEPLRDRLLGDHVVPLGKWHWQLEPFVRADAGVEAVCLYKDWPSDQMPPPGDELDFAQSKQRLLSRQQPLKKRAAELTEKLGDEIQEAKLDTPLAVDFNITNTNLVSFAVYTNQPVAADFVHYLNALRKHAKLDGWPHLEADDGEVDLAARFQQIYTLWIDRVPTAKDKLTVDNTNYFAAAWQSLKMIEKTRQEKQRAGENVEKLRERLQLVPDSLDKVAYVSLFMTDPPRPGLEMIRFDAH